jgi:CspA family cold shock protein
VAIGKVKWFNATKGYGFIEPDGGGKDVFVHISAVEKAGFNSLAEGAKVRYEIITDRGKESAGNLRGRLIAALAALIEQIPDGRQLPDRCACVRLHGADSALSEELRLRVSASLMDTAFVEALEQANSPLETLNRCLRDNAGAISHEMTPDQIQAKAVESISGHASLV